MHWITITVLIAGWISSLMAFWYMGRDYGKWEGYCDGQRDGYQQGLQHSTEHNMKEWEFTEERLN